MSKRLRMLEQAIAAGSTDPFHYYARALELRSLERPEEALGALREVTERFPDYVPTYLIAAQVAVELERPDEARQLLETGAEKAKQGGDEHALSEITLMLEGL